MVAIMATPTTSHAAKEHEDVLNSIGTRKPTSSRRRPREPLDLEAAKAKSNDPRRSIEQPSMTTDQLLDTSVISCRLIQESVSLWLLHDQQSLYIPQKAANKAAAGLAAAAEAQKNALVLDLNPDLKDDGDEDAKPND